MHELDRRKGDERRKSKRYAVSIDVEWESHYGRRPGTLSDISEDGCFVLSQVDVTDGELVKVYIPLTDGMKVEFLGQVANYVYEIGFAVHFLSLTQAQREFLANFVEVQRQEPVA
ncbi:MAG TPA: PilZ domain-containing protein [Pyrinomonadaceae bacterium]